MRSSSVAPGGVSRARRHHPPRRRSARARVFPLRSDVVGIVDELIGRVFDEMDYERGFERAVRRAYAPGEGQKPQKTKRPP